MLSRLIGKGTTSAALRDGLAASSREVQRIAHRVANAATPSSGDFATALDEAQAGGAGSPVDLEQEMVALADEQIRFEATAQLLTKVYQQIRTGIREG